MESRKIVLKNLFTGSNGESGIENRLMDMGRGEVRVRYMERGTLKLTLPYVKEIANGNLLYGSGILNRGSMSTKRDRMGREMRGSFKREDIYIPMADSC